MIGFVLKSVAGVISGSNIPPPVDDPSAVVATIINFVIGIMGLVSVGYIIYGGVQYSTSAGDSSKIQRAKNTILYAVIGLIIAGLAFAIVNFVVQGLATP